MVFNSGFKGLKVKISSVLYSEGSATNPNCILLRPHVIQNIVIKIKAVTKEIGHVTFTLVSEIPQYLTRVGEISRYAKSIYLLINCVVVNSRFETRVITELTLLIFGRSSLVGYPQLFCKLTTTFTLCKYIRNLI